MADDRTDNESIVAHLDSMMLRGLVSDNDHLALTEVLNKLECFDCDAIDDFHIHELDDRRMSAIVMACPYHDCFHSSLDDV